VNRKPKLLYLIGQFPAINHGYLLAEVRLLRRLGFEIEVVSVSTPDRPQDALSDAEREEAARTYYIKSLSAARIVLLNAAELVRHPLRYLRGLSFTLRLAGAGPKKVPYHLAYFAEAIVLGRRMRELGITHVHANFSATVALIAAKVFPIEWSFTVHGFGELHDPSATHLKERIESAAFVRCISRFGRGQLMLSCDRSEWSKLLYSPLGIDPAEFGPSADIRNQATRVRLLCVGRLSEEKGQALLVDAVAALSAQGLLVELHLVGDGPDRKWLEQYAQQLGVSSQIVFEGWIGHPKILTSYANADICVLSSLAEGIPVVLMEAMALEIPCVAPCISGIPELIEDGISGLLFSVADVGDLTQKIRMLVEAPELRQRMGKQGREKVVRDYDISRNSARFATLLEEQLAGKP
jgi:colanic acid/amylovoran biosynthesis glycosyltransferase